MASTQEEVKALEEQLGDLENQEKALLKLKVYWEALSATPQDYYINDHLNKCVGHLEAKRTHLTDTIRRKKALIENQEKTKQMKGV